jgi:signal transduction histidine kinase
VPPEGDLSSLVREIEGRLRRTRRDRKVEITVDDVRLDCDLQLLEDVLEQLLGMAWEVTRARPVGHVQVGQIKGPDGAAFFVRDDGPGSADVDDPDLAEIAAMVAPHGGRIWAEAAPGAGTTIYFRLA